MFTGIIEDLGLVTKVQTEGSNLHLWVKSKLTSELQIDQSVAHNGVCLTVVDIQDDIYKVTAVEETLKKTTTGSLKVDSIVNLERSMVFGARVDGHMVYGHVDGIGTCKSIEKKDGSYLFVINFPSSFSKLLVEKGSISLNGTSLTVFDVTDDSFTIAIIPYTYEHTSIKKLEIGSSLNLEFDIFGKYVEKHFSNIR